MHEKACAVSQQPLAAVLTWQPCNGYLAFKLHTPHANSQKSSGNFLPYASPKAGAFCILEIGKKDLEEEKSWVVPTEDFTPRLLGLDIIFIPASRDKHAPLCFLQTLPNLKTCFRFGLDRLGLCFPCSGGHALLLYCLLSSHLSPLLLS